MAGDLTFGAVPPLYREIYDIVCPNQERVEEDVFLKLLVKSSLPKSTLSQVWHAVDSNEGYLTRNGLYKALALIALAQQGKSINEKLLESYSDQELPRPQMGDLADLKELSIRIWRERSPTVLGYSFKELCELETVKIELMPEKKGLILKHVEYEVTSKRYKTTVRRRYNDFITFYDTLLGRFPYRMVPRLPPKKIGADREFIEHRRRSLQRFLTLVVRHPVLTHDNIVKYFFTFNGTDFQSKMKDHFKGVPDEYMTNDVAHNAKDLVPMDTQTQFCNSKDHMRALECSVSKLKDIAERLVYRATVYASDMLQVGQELSSLGHENASLSSWATGNNNTWPFLQKGFKRLSLEYTLLSDRASTAAAREQEYIVNDLHMFLDLLNSYKDLCERHEKGVLHDHQKALQKLGQYKKKQMTASVQGSGQANANVDQLEQRIIKQESMISNMENRNYFSLYCVQMETQLIHANLDSLYISLNNMIMEEAKTHTELGAMWEKMKPIVQMILPEEQRLGKCLQSSPSCSPTNLQR